jgi:Lysozyme like domain
MAAAPAQHFSYAQLEGLWIGAGGPRDKAAIAAAIAEAESGGWSNAAYPSTYVTPGQGRANDATGLWQILGPPEGFSAEQLTDPSANAEMAVAKWKEAGGWSPWKTYKNGAYKRFLSNSTTPDTSGNKAGEGSEPLDGGTESASCAWFLGVNLPSVSVPLIGTVGGGREGICLLGKSQARAILGAAFLIMGGAWAVIALFKLAGMAGNAALEDSKAARLLVPSPGQATGAVAARVLVP